MKDFGRKNAQNAQKENPLMRLLCLFAAFPPSFAEPEEGSQTAIGQFVSANRRPRPRIRVVLDAARIVQ